MDIKTIEWSRGKIKIIDQSLLPQELEFIYLKDLPSLWRAIRLLKVRGAPALGAAAALGVYLGVESSREILFPRFYSELNKVIAYLASSRPTARNLFFGLERMREVALENKDKPVKAIKEALFKEAQLIIKEDTASCERLSLYGARLIKDNDKILTICNAGALATIECGTALGVIYRAHREGKSLKVYACETRPLLQGARLTAWELQREGIDTTLICDNMAATVMRKGWVDKVIVGADRIAANGDTANKIGTYNLAVLCKYHAIPFYVAAPSSTFDLKMNSGSSIPIEERPAEEITEMFFKKPIAPKGTKVFNPAFDLTPHGLISGIITDKGLIKPPYVKNIARILRGR
ncbi:MAG TPA: S-methyl-5-thioribose-1-phosphate isomerase [Candidatus Margulisiibacteriota bacterium]|nr:S-methyl-5-thioribose-1-phosphate isomerase [Candidatus Margulisiibacteriota bacterium]